jgi:hypothetical protein
VLTPERLKELRFKVGELAVVTIHADELAELLAAYDVAEAAAKVERERRDGGGTLSEEQFGSPPRDFFLRTPRRGMQLATATFDSALRLYELVKLGQEALCR